jgi:hypothetical protein
MQQKLTVAETASHIENPALEKGRAKSFCSTGDSISRRRADPEPLATCVTIEPIASLPRSQGYRMKKRRRRIGQG